MKLRIVFGLAAFASVLSMAHEASAECNNLRFGSVPQFNWQGEGTGYNPFDPTTYNEEGTVKVRINNGTCRFFVTFSEGNSSSFDRYMLKSGLRLNYNTYDDVSQSNVLKDLPTATANEVLSGQFSGGPKNQTLTYSVSIPPGQVQPRGRYQDRVTLRLYEGTVDDHSLAATKRLTLRARIPEVAEVAIVATGAPFDESATAYTVNFGVLQEGELERFDLLVRSNTGYRVLMSSDNRGVLERVGGASGTVPYTLSIDGRIIDLSPRNVEVASKSSATGVGGDRYGTEVNVGTLADAVPGTYRDDITVTVRTN